MLSLCPDLDRRWLTGIGCRTATPGAPERLAGGDIRVRGAAWRKFRAGGVAEPGAGAIDSG